MRQKRFGLLCAVVAGIIMILPGACGLGGVCVDRVKEFPLRGYLTHEGIGVR